jgi:ubiquinone/menaquinone biosynthesis C-methylase UbiE
VAPGATVVDVGAGYCEFINNITAGRKLAIDLNRDTERHAAPDVEVIHNDASAMNEIDSDSVDVVFMSNFLEHLHGKAEVLATLQESRRVIRPGGRLMILQPNIRFLPGEYWDFFDHQTPLSDRSLTEALRMIGMKILVCHPRFLPYTTKSRLPKASLLVRWYLRLPFLWRLLGRQTLIIAEK